MPIERTAPPSEQQSFIDSNLQAQSPFLTESDDQPIEVTIGPEDGETIAEVTDEQIEEPTFDANLAEYVDDGVLAGLGTDLLHDFNNDKMARADWERTYQDGLKLLGLSIEHRSEPWDGACGVFHPLLTEAAVRFQSEMIAETFPAPGPVKARIIGKVSREVQDSANRVVQDMNYQLTENMPEFRPEHERMLWNLSLAGAAFKKVYFDPTLNRPTSVFVPAEDLYMPYGASDSITAERVTHAMRKTKNEIKKLQYQGFYRDVELTGPTQMIEDIQEAKDRESGASAINDERLHILEMQVELDLEGFEDIDPDTGEETGIALPYVVTLERHTGEVLAIRRNWTDGDGFKNPRQHIVQYTYIPGFGSYGYGLIHLVGGFAESATSILRQLIDAGTLSNLPGGLKTNGLRIKNDSMPIAPGEWRDVDVAGGTMRDNIMPLPYKEPSATLFNLLQNVVDEGRRLAAVADVKIDAMSSEAPVGTTLAILERTLKVMSAVQSRVHTSMAQEFKLLAALIRDYTAPDYSYLPDDKSAPSAKKDDYAQTDIIPVSDPNATTMAQRILQYQAAVQLAAQAPQIYNLPLLHQQMLEVMGIKDAAKIVETDDDMVPSDPVTENQMVLKQQPVKAFIEQDHEAHIQVHQAFMQDPIVAQIMGQNPQAQAITQAGYAHLAEHVGFAYRKRIEVQLGVPLPDPGQSMDPDLEAQVAPLLAQAAMQVAQQSAAQAQAQAAQANANDPVVQQQQKELEIRQQELQAKVQIEMEKINAQKMIAAADNDVKLQLQKMKDGTEHFKTGFNATHEHFSKANDHAHQTNTAQANQQNANQTQTANQAFELQREAARAQQTGNE